MWRLEIRPISTVLLFLIVFPIQTSSLCPPSHTESASRWGQPHGPVAGHSPSWGRDLWHRLTTNLLSSQKPREESVIQPKHDPRDELRRIHVSSRDEAAIVVRLAKKFDLDLWEATEDWVDLRARVETLDRLIDLLPSSMRSNHTTLLRSDELSQAISATQNETTYSRLSPPLTRHDPVFFEDYQPLSVIMAWMSLLASLHPEYVTMISVGTTHEGRDIPALRIGRREPDDGDGEDEPRRRTVLVSGGSHAREWVSTSTVNYIAHAFITDYPYSGLLQNFEWIFLPTLNPDGYIYTWTNDRLWRKNRQTTSGNYCPGIDLDRTWGFQWDGSHSNGNPCSETYAGNSPFDGVESQQLAAWIQKQVEEHGVDLVGVLDLHSYSQQILYPYSFSCDAIPPSLENLEELAQGLAKAIRMEGKKSYKVTSACKGNVDLLASAMEPGQGGGSALDWFYHEMNIHYTYQIKLRDTGSYGFLLPKRYIIPTAAEILQAVLYFGHHLSSNLGLANTASSNSSAKDLYNSARQWELKR